MKESEKLEVGDKVTYFPHSGKPEIGIVKGMQTGSETNYFVVYNCGGDWENYRDYTGANTHIRLLKKGWYLKQED